MFSHEIMSKTSGRGPLGSGNKKKKQVSLSITEKVELLQKLDKGVPVWRLVEEYGVGTTTVYDIKKQKDKILKFYRESDDQKLMNGRKTLHK